MKVTKEEIISMASTIQKLKLHLEDVSSSYEAEERLFALFEEIIGRFYKMYDEEEELDAIIDRITHVLTADDTSFMYEELRNKEDVEKKEKKQRLGSDYMQKIMFLVCDYKRDLEQ